MKEQKEYEICIYARVLSTLKPDAINHQLVASLFNIDTMEKISDGDDERFEILDYNNTNVKIIEDSKEVVNIY